MITFANYYSSIYLDDSSDRRRRNIHHTILQSIATLWVHLAVLSVRVRVRAGRNSPLRPLTASCGSSSLLRIKWSGSLLMLRNYTTPLRSQQYRRKPEYYLLFSIFYKLPRSRRIAPAQQLIFRSGFQFPLPFHRINSAQPPSFHPSLPPTPSDVE